MDDDDDEEEELEEDELDDEIATATTPLQVKTATGWYLPPVAFLIRAATFSGLAKGGTATVAMTLPDVTVTSVARAPSSVETESNSAFFCALPKEANHRRT